MRVLFTSKNLIGDGLNIYPALRRFRDSFPDAKIDLLTLDDQMVPIYAGMDLNIDIVFEEPKGSRYDFMFTFDVGKAFALGDRYKIHIAQAYYNMLKDSLMKFGYGLNEGRLDLHLYFNAGQINRLDSFEEDLVIISPFSRSCTSNEGRPPNKMLKYEHWDAIVPLLKSYGKIGVVCRREDKDKVSKHMEWADYIFYDYHLTRIALLLKSASLVVTIDNGIAHLAASQNARMLEFYPACLGPHWIIPENSNMLGVIQIDPAHAQSDILVNELRTLLPEVSKVT